MSEQPVHVFISYSHDSDTHVRTVLELANTLRTDGVDAQLDRFIEAPPEGWPRWVGRQVADADFIICVCSAQYRTSFEGRNDPQKGLGVNQEGFLIQQDLYDHANRSERYVPVVFDRGGRDTIPGTLRAFQSYELPAQYEQLYRRVTRNPEVLPPILSWPPKIPAAPRQPAVANLPEKSEGFGAQAEISEFLTPKQYPVERLAPRDGLYLSRIINPQQRTINDLITTVWITARGPLDYVVDSIRIKDRTEYGLGGNPVVTITPDAEYRFTYAEASDVVHALNPALAIGPATRQRASFTLGTAMERGYYYTGTLFIWVGYQVSNGTTGTLLLGESPADGCKLAKLLGADVEFPILFRGYANLGPLVITPEGLQRGFELQNPPEYRYVPILISEYPLPSENANRDRLLRARENCRQALDARASLNKALANDAKREELKNWLAQGSGLAADLLGGMADEQSTAILLQQFQGSQASLAITGLCVRHLATGDDLLVRLAREHESAFSLSVLNSGGTLAGVIWALMLRPLGSWMDLLLLYQGLRADVVRNILEELDPELTPEQRAEILAAPGGPFGCELFVRGTMNNWTAPPNAELVYQGDGTYSGKQSLEPDTYALKIGSADWRQGNLGGRKEGLRITAGEQVDLFWDNLSHNLYLDLTSAPAAEYTFTLDARSLLKPLLRITRA